VFSSPNQAHQSRPRVTHCASNPVTGAGRRAFGRQLSPRGQARATTAAGCRAQGSRLPVLAADSSPLRRDSSPATLTPTTVSRAKEAATTRTEEVATARAKGAVSPTRMSRGTLRSRCRGPASPMWLQPPPPPPPSPPRGQGRVCASAAGGRRRRTRAGRGRRGWSPQDA
jgi:hypothetical protein